MLGDAGIEIWQTLHYWAVQYLRAAGIGLGQYGSSGVPGWITEWTERRGDTALAAAELELSIPDPLDAFERVHDAIVDRW